MVFIISSAYAQNGNTELNDYTDSLSYIIGRDVGAQLRELGTQIRISQFSQGVDQAMRGEPSRIDSATADSIRRRFADDVQQRLMQEQQELAEKNRKESESFLAQNRKRKEVRSTQSGLQYQVIQEGNGQSPTINDSVRVSYKGIFLDSTVFDSTSADNPAVLDLQRTIPGIAEGLQLMNVGSTYRFFVPPDLAYGAQGAPPAIPPNATLIFDITLHEIMGREVPSRFKK